LDQVFVSRQVELEKLDSLLALAIEGSGQICFVTDEAGFGKTSLTAEFARRAQLRDEAIREAAEALARPATYKKSDSLQLELAAYLDAATVYNISKASVAAASEVSSAWS